MQNPWIDTLLLLTALQASVLISILIRKKRNAIFLIFLLGLLGLLSVFKAYDDLGFYLKHPHSLRVHWGAVLLIGPFTYLHFRGMIASQPRFLIKQDLWHFGFFGVNIGFMLPFWLLDGEQKLLALDLVSMLPQTGYGFYKTYYSVFHGVAALQCSLYASFIKQLIQENEAEIKNQFSKISPYTLSWGNVSVIGLLGLGILFWAIAIINLSKFYLLVDYEQWAMLALFLGVYHISYKTFQQAHLGQMPRKADPEPEPMAKASLDAEELSRLNTWAKNLRQLLETDKLYLNPELSQPELANSLGISRHELSKVLKEVVHKNFYDLINEYRVKECQSLIANPRYEHYTLLAIGLEAGFSSKTTFNTFFKKVTGKTPSEFKKNLV